MGVDIPHDPDPNYELTTDNVKKIMAIYMRFRYTSFKVIQKKNYRQGHSHVFQIG